MNTKKKFEKGQAILLIAIAMAALIVATGLAVDTGLGYSAKRHAQNAADAAALAAGLAQLQGQDPVTAARLSARQNGFSDSEVTVNIPPTDQGCRPNNLGNPSGNEVYIQVIIRSQQDTAFARLIRRNNIDVCAEAIVRVSGGGGSSSSPLFGGMAIVATNPDRYTTTFLLNGNSRVITHGSGIFVNSSFERALMLNGGAILEMDTYGYTVSGMYGINGNATVTPGIHQGQQMQITADTFSFIPPIPSEPSCSGNGYSTTSGNTITYYPGNFESINTTGYTNVIFQPGVYCVTNNFIIQSTTVTTNGTVKWVMRNQDVTFNGSTTFNISDLEIYTHNGTWTFNGGQTFTANRLRFYSSGSGRWIVNGVSTIRANDAFFYLTSGYIVWNSSATIDLHTPPEGDPFSGLVIYMPYGNTNYIVFNGGDNIKLTGSYLAPTARMTVNGNVRANAIHSQIIVFELIVNGGSTLEITYNADENIKIENSTSPTIELVE